MLKPCIQCGTPSDTTRCTDCGDPRGTATARGYDARWSRLSKRARRLQPFCSTCGSTDDLTTDHSPEAWRRHAAGLPVRLEDVDVLCRGCNTRKGRARPQGDGAASDLGKTCRKPYDPLHTPGGYA